MIVLDAAAPIDVVLDQPTAAWGLQQMVDEEVVAPAHQLAEVASAVARMQRAGSLSSAVAHAAVAEAAGLPQSLVTPSAAHLRRALDLQERIRILDGLYVAVAEDRACPW